MILYDLRCAKGHVFEAWFRDGAAFERQAKRGDIACPSCGERKVAKSPMAPNLTSGSRSSESGSGDLAGRQAQLAAVVKAVREVVEKNFENVGPRFAAEARRIHYGECEKRNIYGEANSEDVRELSEEGVEFAILPRPPRMDS